MCYVSSGRTLVGTDKFNILAPWVRENSQRVKNSIPCLTRSLTPVKEIAGCNVLLHNPSLITLDIKHKDTGDNWYVSRLAESSDLGLANKVSEFTLSYSFLLDKFFAQKPYCPRFIFKIFNHIVSSLRVLLYISSCNRIKLLYPSSKQ